MKFNVDDLLEVRERAYLGNKANSTLTCTVLALINCVSLFVQFWIFGKKVNKVIPKDEVVRNLGKW